MAAAVYTLANVNGYTTPIGSRALGIRKLSWNTGTYANPAGYAASRQSFGLRGFDTAWGGISAGGHYRVDAQIVSGPGGATVNFRLFILSTGVEVANGAALTADSVTVGAIGG
ncbi:MAG TPA: hypothetical protein VJY15_24855 [Candidatus Acidoferrum sp.]|nr:hypothetical protein [Candidatus Acidoferrum sp.]